MALVPFPSQTPDEQRPAEDEDAGGWLDRGDGGGGKMSFLEHLDELRKRLIWSAAAIGGGFLIAFAFITPLFNFVMEPLARILPKGQTLVYTEPMEAFTLYIWIAAIAGLLIATPVVMTQVWLFVAPGLYQHEKKMAVPFVVLTSICFISGAAFSHYVAFPSMWKFGASFATDYVTFMPRIEPAFDFYLKMLLAFGLVFQMPPLVLFLARMGVVTGGFMMRQFKFAILIIFIAAAILTPSGDMFNQTIMAAPMIGLYLISALLAWMFGKKRIKEPEEELLD